MKFERRYTVAGTPVADQIEWETREASIPGAGFHMTAVEVPKVWSQDATNILAQKFFRKAGVPNAKMMIPESGLPNWLCRRTPTGDATFGSEKSARQVFHRMAGCWTYWGWREGYFANAPNISDSAEESAHVFYDELFWMLANQVAAPNSPQWFNTGLHWAYGIEGPDAGLWAFDVRAIGADDVVAYSTPERHGAPYEIDNAYERPQVHACFLTPTIDDLVNPGGIMDTWVREAKIFKQGSGSGVNVSAWRGKGEPLSGGGKASGVMSFLRIGDSSAGAIQSGGTTRRAAKMVCMDADHPEIEEFIDWKVREEAKAAAMYVGSLHLKDYASVTSDRAKPHRDAGMRDGGWPEAVIDRLNAGFEPEVFGIDWEGEAYRTVDGQNSNNSVRVRDEFMRRAARRGDFWDLTARTTGEVVKTVESSQLWLKICRAAWASADPGLLFHTTINAWNTCAADGVIRTTNPCAEFHHLDGSACDLASLNLGKFLDPPIMEKRFDCDAFEHACRLWTVVLDISVSMAGFPAREFAEAARNYRTLGLGYANLGGLLTRMGLRYDSDDGRSLAAGVTALMTGVAYRTSYEMATELGPFPRWEANADSMQKVLIKHRFAVGNLECADPAGDIIVHAWDVWKTLPTDEPHRNAQATLLAPTGTIALVMDCETTGVEPFYSRSAVKRLAGGGTMMIEHNVMEEDCAVPSRPDGPCLSPEAHVKMVAAVQPFLSGGVSKTINMPHDATVEDVDHIYWMAHSLGLKSIAIYRDGSKLTQPLETTKEHDQAAAKLRGERAPATPQMANRQELKTTESQHVAPELRGSSSNGQDIGIATELQPGNPKMGVRVPQTSDTLRRGERRELPSRRPRANRVKLEVGGQSVYISTGDHEDGSLGEIFIGLSREGAHVRSMMECFSKSISIGLQYGVPLEVFVEAFIHTKFDPAGMVVGDTRVRFCSSLPDLIVRHLAVEYLGREDLASVPRAVDAETVAKLANRISPSIGREDLESALRAADSEAVVKLAANITPSLQRATHAAPKMVMVDDTCWECHSYGTLMRTGTCITCSACGANSGCA